MRMAVISGGASQLSICQQPPLPSRFPHPQRRSRPFRGNPEPGGSWARKKLLLGALEPRAIPCGDEGRGNGSNPISIGSNKGCLAKIRGVGCSRRVNRLRGTWLVGTSSGARTSTDRGVLWRHVRTGIVYTYARTRAALFLHREHATLGLPASITSFCAAPNRGAFLDPSLSRTSAGKWSPAVTFPPLFPAFAESESYKVLGKGGSG